MIDGSVLLMCGIGKRGVDLCCIVSHNNGVSDFGDRRCHETKLFKLSESGAIGTHIFVLKFLFERYSFVLAQNIQPGCE